MRIRALSINAELPIENFEATDLADRVVIAGPNGVGKTRLKDKIIGMIRNPVPGDNGHLEIDATNQDELNIFGVKTISTRNQDHCDRLRQLIQKSRRRKNISSSIVHIESNRSVENYNLLPYQWNMPDPDDEELGWDISSNSLNSRWNDTQGAIFRKLISLRTKLGEKALAAGGDGKDITISGFRNPMEPFEEAFSQLLHPKSLVEPDLANQQLKFTASGISAPLPVSALSSGEKEVVRIVFDIIMRAPKDSIFVIDEPELHLHPELLLKLVKTLETIGKNNQFIFFSHSPDIISASIDDTVIFMRPPNGGRNQAILANRDNEAVQGLKMLGQSIGVISLGKKVILIEGQDASLDKKLYTQILPAKNRDFVLLPSGGVGTISRFEAVQKSILDQSIWGVDFFVLCDGDTKGPRSNDENLAHSRFRRLPKYHIENYFLDPITLFETLKKLGHPSVGNMTVETIADEIRGLAKNQIGYAVALFVTDYIREQPGHVTLVPSNCNGMTEENLVSAMIAEAVTTSKRTQRILSEVDITKLTKDWYRKIEASINEENLDWHRWIPGRLILRPYLSRVEVKDWIFKKAYIELASNQTVNPFSEIENIFEEFRTIGESSN